MEACTVLYCTMKAFVVATYCDVHTIWWRVVLWHRVCSMMQVYVVLYSITKVCVMATCCNVYTIRWRVVLWHTVCSMKKIYIKVYSMMKASIMATQHDVYTIGWRDVLWHRVCSMVQVNMVQHDEGMFCDSLYIVVKVYFVMYVHYDEGDLIYLYGVAMISRLPKNIGHFWKRALERRPTYSAKKTYIFKVKETGYISIRRLWLVGSFKHTSLL